MLNSSQRQKYKFKCSHCNKTWNGNDLSLISKRVSRHWNKNHHDDLRHTYKQIDEKVMGGHHVHGNEHIVEKIPVYITCFDVMDRLGKEDGFAVLDEDISYCDECMKFLDYDEEKEYCEECKQNLKIQKAQSENYQIDSF